MKTAIAVLFCASSLLAFDEANRTKDATKGNKEFREALGSLKPGTSLSEVVHALKPFERPCIGQLPSLVYFLKGGSTFHLFFTEDREKQTTHLICVASFKLSRDGKLTDGRILVPTERKGEKTEYQSVLEMLDKEQMKYK